jgi:hypothetical protein
LKLSICDRSHRLQPRGSIKAPSSVGDFGYEAAAGDALARRAAWAEAKLRLLYRPQRRRYGSAVALFLNQDFGTAAFSGALTLDREAPRI